MKYKLYRNSASDIDLQLFGDGYSVVRIKGFSSYNLRDDQATPEAINFYKKSASDLNIKVIEVNDNTEKELLVSQVDDNKKLPELSDEELLKSLSSLDDDKLVALKETIAPESRVRSRDSIISVLLENKDALIKSLEE